MEKKKPPAEKKGRLRTAKLILKSVLARRIDQIYIKFTEGWHSQRGMEESDGQLAMFGNVQILNLLDFQKQKNNEAFLFSSKHHLFLQKHTQNHEKKTTVSPSTI